MSKFVVDILITSLFLYCALLTLLREACNSLSLIKKISRKKTRSFFYLKKDD